MASTVDLAGALAAIETRLAVSWSLTPVIYENIEPEGAFPPVNEAGSLLPWVFVELIDVGADIIGFGTPTNQTVLDSGFLRMHVMAPKGDGLTQARQYAVALGEIFRQQQFFNADPTAYVRTLTPQVGRGEAQFDDGNWVSMSCTVPYQFFHRA